MLRSLTAIVLVLTAAGQLHAEDWLRFRGPNGSGISTESADVPTSWSPVANIAWKVELPGAGVSSPIVVGNRVLVTSYSGYGLDRQEPGDIENLKRHLVCFDLASGKKLWQKDFDAEQPEDPYTGIGVTAHGYASHTPVSDGENVYAFFGKSGVYAFDLEGNQLWHTEVGKESDPRKWGSSSSPVLYGDKVIVTAAAESQSIIGLDKNTGDIAWKQEASGLDNMWGTPILVELEDGRTDLVMGVPREIWGLDPETGKMRWYCEATRADQSHSSVIADPATDRIFGFSGRGGGSVAVQAGGKGNTTETAVKWTGRENDRFGSPVMVDDRVYLVSGGIVNAIDAKTGESIEQVRLEGAAASGRGFGSADYASPVVANGKLYYLNGSGQMFVFQLGEAVRQIAMNRVTTERESFGGTPAISQGNILLRSDKHLYCVKAMGQEVNPEDNKVAQAEPEAPAGGRPGFNRGGGNRGGQNRGGGNRGEGRGRPEGGFNRGGGRPGGGFNRGGDRQDDRPQRPQRPEMVDG